MSNSPSYFHIYSYLHFAVDPGQNTFDFGVNTRSVFFTTANSPACNPGQVPTAVSLTHQRSTTVPLEIPFVLVNTGFQRCMFKSQRMLTCPLTLTAHLTGVFASIQIPSTEHVLGHGASIHYGTVTHTCVYEVHSHFHQFLGDNACVGGNIC